MLNDRDRDPITDELREDELHVHDPLRPVDADATAVENEEGGTGAAGGAGAGDQAEEEAEEVDPTGPYASR